jgi:hypothetical protein
MGFERIAGPRKGKATANRAKAQSGGNVRGSNPNAAGNIIKPVKETFVNKGSKNGGNTVDNTKRGSKSFFNPKASN